MVNIESNELFNSIKEEIDKRIEKAKAYLEKKQEKLKDPTKKLGMLDNVRNESWIKPFTIGIVNDMIKPFTIY